MRTLYQKKRNHARAAALILAGGVLLGGSVLGGHGHLISLAADTASQLPLRGEAIGALVIPGRAREAERPVRIHDKRTAVKAERVEIQEEGSPSQPAAAALHSGREGSHLGDAPASAPSGASQEAPEEDAPGMASQEAPEVVLSDEDVDLLARITMAEAESESELGKRLVIDTVLNRMEDSRFPDTVSGVIYQPHQFSPVENGRLSRCYVQDEIRDLVLEECMTRTNRECLYFQRGSSCPWGTLVLHEGGHYFFM